MRGKPGERLEVEYVVLTVKHGDVSALGEREIHVRQIIKNNKNKRISFDFA